MTSNRHIAPTLLITLCLIGCSQQVELHHGLSEAEANTIALLLESQGIPTGKRAGSQSGQWIVEVASPHRIRALEALEERGLPRRSQEPPQEGLMGLIPTPSEQQEAHLLRLSARVERSLLTIDGVLDARVHLVLPSPPRTRPDAPVEAKASALIKHEPEVTLTPEQLAAFIAGAVPGLSPEQVHVITSPLTPKREVVALSQYGPWLVATESVQSLRLSLQLLVCLWFLLLVGLVVYQFKIRSSDEQPPQNRREGQHGAPSPDQRA